MQILQTNTKYLYSSLPLDVEHQKVLAVIARQLDEDMTMLKQFRSLCPDRKQLLITLVRIAFKIS